MNRKVTFTAILLPAAALMYTLVAAPRAEAIPYYARRYDTQCSTCHVMPPKLNRTGEDFLARGYRFEGGQAPRKTIPLSVWSSFRGKWHMSRDFARGLPNRVEIISAGPVRDTRAFYFVEWLPVSQQVGANNQRVQRHGRFEDLFLSVPLGPLSLTTGQFRQLSQVDVSRRLSLSEPLAFATGVGGAPALSPRLSGLRSFSLSGRSPAFRVAHHWRKGERASEGWYNSVTVPFAGELVIPLNSTVHRTQGFAFEFRPKGAFLESYFRKGLNSVGGHAFLGKDRRQLGVVGSVNRGPFFSMFAAGYGRERSGADDFRFSWENEFIPREWVALGLRVDDRTGANRPAALIPYVNLQFPLTRYTVRLTGEHRQQRGSRQWLLELGTVF